MEIQNVTFIGLGVMGYNMAGHLKKNNFNTTVYNRTSSVSEKWVNEFGGESKSTPGEASSNADIVCICVGRDEDLISVMEGNDGIINNIKNKFANINSYGSIGCEYFDIALGKRDFTLLSRLYPWDHIPGVFIVRQSGGHDCHFDKKEYKFYKDSKNLIVSNSKNLNYDILNLIKGE